MNARAAWLVTGANGVLGRCVVERLASDGVELRLLDQGRPVAASGERITVVRAENDAALERALASCTGVVHAAALLEGDAAALHAANAAATGRLAACAARAGVRRFVYVSTAAVLAPGAFADADELHPTGPSEPYAASKFEGEERARRLLGERLVIVRLPSIVGPGRTRFVEQLAAAVLHHTLPLRADDGAFVECVHAHDVARAIAALVAGRGTSALFHLAGPRRPRFGELVRFVAELLRVEPRFVPLPAPSVHFEPALLAFATIERSLSSARARRELGWEPLVDWHSALTDLAAQMPR